MTQAEAIIAKIAKDFGLGPKDLWGSSRRREFVKCRVLIWCVLRYLGWSVLQIERRYGRDHATIAKLSKQAGESVKEEACDYIRKFGGEPLTWMVPSQKGKRMIRHKIEPKPPVCRPPKPKVFKKVPDYQNYCIKLVEV